MCVFQNLLIIFTHFEGVYLFVKWIFCVVLWKSFGNTKDIFAVFVFIIIYLQGSLDSLRGLSSNTDVVHPHPLVNPDPFSNLNSILYPTH